MALTVDDFRRISASARERVAGVHARSVEQFAMPDVERRELAEYDGLTPEQHGQVMQTVGPEKYQEYADAMEKLRVKHGG